MGGDRGLLRKCKPGCWPTRLQLLVDRESLLAPEPARSSSGAVGSPGLVPSVFAGEPAGFCEQKLPDMIGLAFYLGFSWFVGC